MSNIDRYLDVGPL